MLSCLFVFFLNRRELSYLWSELLLVSVGGFCVYDSQEASVCATVMKVERDSRLTKHRCENECNVGVVMM